MGGYLAPAVVLATLVLPGAIVARVAPRVLVSAALVALPIAIAVGLVSVFTRPGATVLFTVGPFDATLEGANFAAQVVWRLFVMGAALLLFGTATPPRAFIVDLERRGVSPRFAFAIGAVLETLPALAERGRDVLDAQRSRGLDVDDGVVGRAAAIVPLAGPVIIGALHHADARTLALEARGLGRPGPRHLLWAPPDTGRQRLARWLLIALLVGILVGVVSGALPRLP